MPVLRREPLAHVKPFPDHLGQAHSRAAAEGALWMGSAVHRVLSLRCRSSLLRQALAFTRGNRARVLQCRGIEVRARKR